MPQRTRPIFMRQCAWEFKPDSGVTITLVDKEHIVCKYMLEIACDENHNHNEQSRSIICVKHSFWL